MPRILSIASPGNGSGKTRLAMTLLAAHPGAFTAVKFTTVYRDGQNCPRTETACACRSLHGMYTVISDPAIIDQEGTDTGRLARAGAARTLWGLSIPSAHPRLWSHLISEVLSPGERLITEGNRIVPVISPDRLVMVMGPEVPAGRWKDDTWDLVGRADAVVVNERVRTGSVPEAQGESIESLRREIARRTKAPVIVQDVTVPLPGWHDPTLAGFLSDLLEVAAASPRPSNTSTPRGSG